MSTSTHDALCPAQTPALSSSPRCHCALIRRVRDDERARREEVGE